MNGVGAILTSNNDILQKHNRQQQTTTTSETREQRYPKLAAAVRNFSIFVAFYKGLLTYPPS